MDEMRFVEINTPHTRWSVWFVFIGGAGGLALFGKFVLPWAPFDRLPAVSAVGTGILCIAIAMIYVRWRTEVRVQGTRVTVAQHPPPRKTIEFDISEIEKVTPATAQPHDPRRTVVEVTLQGGATVAVPTRRAHDLLQVLRPG